MYARRRHVAICSPPLSLSRCVCYVLVWTVLSYTAAAWEWYRRGRDCEDVSCKCESAAVHYLLRWTGPATLVGLRVSRAATRDYFQ